MSKLGIPSCCLAIILILSGCGTHTVMQHESLLDSGSVSDAKYSMIFVIHGDGDYLFHDSSNNELNADMEVLMNAKNVAAQNSNAEVFIFHQKPTRHFLFFFPIKDGEFYHYRNGKLITTESYWRDQDKSNFDTEVTDRGEFLRAFMQNK